MYDIPYPTTPVTGRAEADLTAFRLEREYDITGKLLGHILYRLARTLSPLAGPDPGDAHVWLRVFDNLDKETQLEYVYETKRWQVELSRCEQESQLQLERLKMNMQSEYVGRQ